jgi:GT2 family glycosyltransferase
MNRTPWLKRCISSIRQYCPKPYSVKILSQGYPDQELAGFLARLSDNFEVVISPINLGCGGGRRLLTEKVVSPLIMTIDDDMYLTENAIPAAMQAFRRDDRLGAVSMPQYDMEGRLISAGGRRLIVRNGVIFRPRPRLDFSAELTEVEDLDGGAMIYRSEMRKSFSWDPNLYDFEDLDKSIQIMTDGVWKQGIVPKGKLIHDRSWLARNPVYEKTRFDGLAWRRQYRSFRSKWRMRLDLKSHLLFECAYPLVTVFRSQWVISAINILIQIRATRQAHQARA